MEGGGEMTYKCGPGSLEAKTSFHPHLSAVIMSKLWSLSQPTLPAEGWAIKGHDMLHTERTGGGEGGSGRKDPWW